MAERARHSGLLHSRRTRAGWGGTQDYYARLGQSLNDAEAVLVLIPVIAAMLEPYSSRVRIVPWGMDTARFPWPVAEGPQAGETGGAAPGANGAGAAGRPAVGPEGGVEKASPNEAKTLDEAGPKVIVISCNSEPSPSRPPLSRQAGHSPEGASEGHSAPQPSQQFRSAKIRTRTQCVVGDLAQVRPRRGG